MKRDFAPMLASPAKDPITKLAGTHLFDTKMDGLRAIVQWDGTNITMTNRKGVDITPSFPEVDLELQGSLADEAPCVLDGEVVAHSGSFQDVAHRGKITKALDVRLMVNHKPCLFVAFDILSQGTIDLRPLPYLARRELLDDVPWVSKSDYSSDPDLFEQIRANGGEGVIAKRKTSTYQAGRSPHWAKYRTIRSLTAVGIGYEKGTGAREHFGAMFLALVDANGAPVEIGRVGTGFTATQIDHLKSELDAGRPVVCEINCLNKSKDGKLRFPVYVDIRSDLSVLDARLDQLEQIPTM